MIWVEAMRTWKDWAVHQAAVFLKELKGASDWFGRAVGRPGSIEAGGVMTVEDGTVSAGAYFGGALVGGGAYGTFGDCDN